MVVDLAWFDQEQQNAQPTHINPDLVSLAALPGKRYLSRFVIPEGEHQVVRIGEPLPRELAHGEFIGMAMFPEKDTQAFRECYHTAQKQHQSSPFHESPSLAKASFTDMLQELINQGHHIQTVPIFKGWMEVDSFEEYQKAWAKLRQ